MAASVVSLGIGHRAPDPEKVDAVYAALFGGALAEDDLAVWVMALSERIAVAEAALQRARLQRAQAVAHLHDSFGQSYSAIAEATKGGLSPQRAGQLAAKGRPHIKPLDPKEYGRGDHDH